MADITNLSSFLGDVADAIRSKKGSEESIPAKKFDEEILSIETGIDTSDADATEENIEKGKTAYVNGLKVIGTLADAGGSADIMVSADNISVGNQRGYDCVSTKYTNSGKKIHKDGWYVNQHMKFEDLAPALGVTADKIVAGNTILGVEGTATGGGTVATEGVKLFETIEEMQDDPTAEEGDLALVYRSEINNATVDSQFQVAIFPQTVVLPEAITDYVDIMYRNADESAMFDCWGSLDSSGFSMDCYSDTGSIRITYTSSDGITYTRTRLEGDSIDGDTVDFGTEIKYDRPEYWNDAIGYFIQVGGKYFEGLYEYGPVSYSTHVQCSPLSSLTFDVDGTTVSNIAYSGGTVGGPIEITTIKQIHKTIQAELNNLYDTTYSELFYNTNNELCLAVGVYSAPRYFYTTANGSPLGFSSSQSCGPANIAFNVYKIDLEAKTHTLLTSVYGIGASKKYTPYTDIATIPILFYLGNDSDAPRIPYYWYIGTTPDVSATATIYFSNELGNYPIYKNVEYHLASTQLTLKSPNELLPGKIAYGKNGIITGDGSIYDNLDKEQVFKTFTNINTPIIEDSSDLNRYRLYSVTGDFDTISGYRNDIPIYLAKTNMLDDADYIVGIKSKLVTPKDIAILYKSVKGIDIVVQYIITINDNIICTAVDVNGNKYLLKINSDNTELLSETTIECSSLSLVSYNNVGALVYTDSTTAKSYLIDMNGNMVEIPYVTTIRCYTPDGYLGFVTNSTNSVLYLYNPNTKTINTVGTVNYYNTSNYQGYVSGMMFYNFSDAIYVVCTIQDKKSSVYMYGRCVWKYTKASNTSVSVATMDYSANTSGCSVYGGMCQETCLLSNNVIYDYKKGYYCTLSNSVSVYTGRHAGHITMYLDSEKTNRLYNPYSENHNGIYLDTDVVLTYTYDAYKLNKAPSLPSIDLTPYSPTCVITLDATKIATGLNKFNYSAIGISTGSIDEETGTITYNDDYYEFNYTDTRRIQTLTNFYEDGYYCSSKWDLYYFKESDTPEYVLLKTGFIKDNYSFAPSTKLLPLSVSVQLKPNYDDTISPAEYEEINAIAEDVLGGVE